MDAAFCASTPAISTCLCCRRAADHDLVHQRGADARTAPIGAHVDRVLDREAIAGPRPERAERREADHLRSLHGNEDVEALRPPLHPPGTTVFERRRRLGVDRGGRGDDVVVDREDPGEVRFFGLPNQPLGVRHAAVYII